MKKKLLKRLKLGILILGISLFSTNCQKEDKDDNVVTKSALNKEQIPQEFTIQKLTFKDIKNNSAIFNKFQNKSFEIAAKKDTNTKETSNSNPAFIINKNAIKYIQNQDKTYHSYTFPVYRENTNYGLENLVLSYQSDDNYKAYIVSYDLTEDEILDLKNNLVVDLENKTSLIELDSKQIVSNIFNKGGTNAKISNEDISAKSITIAIEFECCSYGNLSHPNGRYESNGSKCPGHSLCYLYSESGGGSSGSGGNSNGGSSNGNSSGIGPGSGTSSSGGGGGSGGATSPVVDGVEASIRRVNSLIGPVYSLNFKQEKFLRNKDNIGVLLGIEDFLYDNKSNEAKELAESAMDALMNGNTKEKALAKAFLNKDYKLTAKILTEGATYRELTCPYPPCEGEFDAVVLTAEIINGAIDGFGNIILAYFEWTTEDDFQGELMRRVMPKMGIEVPSDVSNETLGELFTFRKRDRELTIEYEKTIKEEIIDVGISALDVVTILSPSKGGGAYLFARTGTGVVTKVAFSKYLKQIKNIASTTLKGGRGHKSFDAFKRAEGNASSGNALHHVVEQNGHKSLNSLKFGKTNIHNTKNIIDIPTGTGTLHDNVTRYYSKIHDFTEEKRFREWIADLPFEEQYKEGIRVLKLHGWDGITGIIN